MRRRRVAAVGLVTMVALGSTALAIAKPSGDPQAIKLAHGVQKAYRKLHVYTQTQTGYVTIKDRRDKSGSGSLNVHWANGVAPSGWSGVTEHETFALNHGRLVWWRDDLVSKCPVGSSCHQVPVEVVVNHQGTFFAFGNAANHGCYGKLSGPTPYHFGGPVYVVNAHFKPVLSKPKADLLSFTFAWNQTRNASETDRVSKQTRLNISGVIKVSSGGAGQAAFTVRFTDAYPGTTPPAPQIKRCSG